MQAAALDVARAQQDTAALKSTRLPQFQTYVLGGRAAAFDQLYDSAGRVGELPGNRADSRNGPDRHTAGTVRGA